MALPIIEFDQNGGDLIAKVIFGYGVQGSYMFELWDGDSKILNIAHNNKTSEGNPIPLPSPASLNNGRAIRCIASISDPNFQDGNKYCVDCVLYQGDAEVGRLNMEGETTVGLIQAELDGKLEAK